MTPLKIYADAEQDFGLDPNRPQLSGTLTCIGLLRHGTTNGKASVALVVDLPDGTQIIAQSTWGLFNTAARALAVSPIAMEETTFD